LNGIIVQLRVGGSDYAGESSKGQLVEPPSTDLVVVLPGILGSTLRRKGHLLWAPSAGSVMRAIRTFCNSIKELEVPAGITDDKPDDGVEPVSLLPDLHILPGIWAPGKGYDRLLARLSGLGYREAAPGAGAPPGNLLPVPYDWRLSNRYNGQRLKSIVEPALDRWRGQGGRYKDAQIAFVCHSMGGLVARWYIEQCGGAELTRKLITLGTPYRGAARGLDALVNGIRLDFGPFSLDLTEFARSMPSLYQLLPEYACLTSATSPGGLAKTTEVGLPELSANMVEDAMCFHTTLRDSETKRAESLANTHAILGSEQATATTATLSEGRIKLLGTYGDEDVGGDGTVPGVGASRADVALDSNALQWFPEKHGSLQRNRAVFDAVRGILTARRLVVRDGWDQVSLRVTVPEIAARGQLVTVEVTPGQPVRYPIQVTVTSETGRLIESRTLKPTNGTVGVTFDSLPQGAHTIDAFDPDRSPRYAPVSSDILVW
jgi:pimeloyl-ACP methyl ester carboxylesterase